MTDSVAAPSPGPSARGSKRQRSTSFERYVDEASDSEDDFVIPHVDLDDISSSESDGSDSDVKVRPRVEQDRQADDNGWVQVTNGTDFRPVFDINFTVRQPLSGRNIPEHCIDPIDYFSLFIDDDFWQTLWRETNRYADQFLGLDATVAWIENHSSSRYTKWPENGVDITKLKKYICRTLAEHRTY
ncbi:hypothetical protein PoB_002775800 [Plakobranchus ocellatus]|uniref:PiggyBac transposable element-derived protein domain-containing protein n=1 Tax=Plakobranchus ocellatus TaxID=259542 RepID=A0AAV4A275_9GAST|nr:hypothetical protein PoB_002775800 [Plakobranchus ocellatus]